MTRKILIIHETCTNRSILRITFKRFGLTRTIYGTKQAPIESEIFILSKVILIIFKGFPNKSLEVNETFRITVKRLSRSLHAKIKSIKF